MFHKTSEYGPGLKCEIKSELAQHKKDFDYESLNETNETGTDWYNFIKKHNLA